MHLQDQQRRDRRYLVLACGISSAILLLEVAGGLWTGSLALLADAGHMLTDIVALLMAFFALLFASRPASGRRTWGYHRLEILSALLNGLFLLALAGVIFWEGVQRLQHPSPVRIQGMIAVAMIGLFANLAGVWFLSRASRSLNMRSAMWHLVGDTVSSVGVIFSGVLMALTGIMQLDAVMSLGISLVIVYGAVRIVREATDILLESVPLDLDRDEVARAIRSVDGVSDVHDLHLWSITTGMPALSGHVIVPRARMLGTDTVLDRIKRVLRDRFKIDHTTIQVESDDFQEIGEVH
ncbi:MAG: cation diffusion facilitator family transporter [Acidobacteriota bacterium]